MATPSDNRSDYINNSVTAVEEDMRRHAAMLDALTVERTAEEVDRAHRRAQEETQAARSRLASMLTANGNLTTTGHRTLSEINEQQLGTPEQRERLNNQALDADREAINNARHAVGQVSLPTASYSVDANAIRDENEHVVVPGSFQDFRYRTSGIAGTTPLELPVIFHVNIVFDLVVDDREEIEIPPAQLSELDQVRTSLNVKAQEIELDLCQRFATVISSQNRPQLIPRPGELHLDNQEYSGGSINQASAPFTIDTNGTIREIDTDEELAVDPHLLEP